MPSPTVLGFGQLVLDKEPFHGAARLAQPRFAVRIGVEVDSVVIRSACIEVVDSIHGIHDSFIETG